MVLLAPGKLCQHILFLHPGKWQPCNEWWAGKWAVQWVVHSALRAGESIKQLWVQHPWALLDPGSCFLLLTAQALVQPAETCTHWLWAACLKYPPLHPGLCRAASIRWGFQASVLGKSPVGLMPLTPQDTDMLFSLTLGPNSCLVCRKLFIQAADLMKAIAKGPGDSWPQPEKITIQHGELSWKRNLRLLIACWWASSAAPSITAHGPLEALRNQLKFVGNHQSDWGYSGTWEGFAAFQRAPDGPLGSARLFSCFCNVHCYMKCCKVGVDKSPWLLMVDSFSLWPCPFLPSAEGKTTHCRTSFPKKIQITWSHSLAACEGLKTCVRQVLQGNKKCPSHGFVWKLGSPSCSWSRVGELWVCVLWAAREKEKGGGGWQYVWPEPVGHLEAQCLAKSAPGALLQE